MVAAATGSATDPPSRGRDIKPGLLLALGGSALLAATLANPFPYVADDALFYLVIGRNVADGHGITFSQVMPTNGFQPLWQAIVTAVIWIAQLVGIDGDVGQLRSVIVACWVCLVGGIVAVDRILRDLDVGQGGRFAAATVALAILGGPYATLATEASLVFLLAALLLLAVERSVRSTGRGVGPTMLVGASAGLLLLARVDTMFLVATALTAHAVRVARGADVTTAIRRSIVAAGTALAAIAPYLAWNQVRFGRLLPISGAVKLRFDRLWLEPASVGTTGWLLLLGAIGLGVAGTAWRRDGVAWPWLIATTGATGAALWYFAFSPGKLTAGSWYHAPYVLAAALAVALLTDAWCRTTPTLRSIAFIGSAVLLLFAAVFSWTERARGTNADQADAVRAFSAEARAALPDGAVLATVDYPGYIALITRHPTVALDGLTGDFEFQQDLRDQGGACTLDRLGATFLVTDAPQRLGAVDGHPDRREQQIAAWLFDGAGSTVQVEDQIVSSEVGLELWHLVPTCER